MKNRNLLTNIFSVLILIALMAFLLISFNLFNFSESLKSILTIISLGVAVVSVACIDIVFPLIDNKSKLAEQKYKIMAIVKIVLFALALVVLLLYKPFGVIGDSPAPALIGFIVLYFAQFFINLDPKPVVAEDDDAEDDEFEDEELEEDTDVQAEVSDFEDEIQADEASAEESEELADKEE